ncbi:AzlC family ABC transporter permease [Spirochaeta dissipatitropha]
MSRHFRRGILLALPIAAGYFPVAVAFGLSATSTGLGFAESAAMSLAVFAGASQFLALGLLAAGAAPVQIIISGVLLNLRHFLFSAAVSDQHPDWRLPQRLANAFGLTDEVFALAATYNDLPPRLLFGMEMTAYSAWVGGTLLGHAVGGVIPMRLAAAMGIGLYGLFAALLAVHVRHKILNLIPAAVAALAHIALRMTALAPGWVFTLAILIGAASALLLPTERKNIDMEEMYDELH